MIDHTGIGVANVEHSAAFYDAVLGALGLGRVKQLRSGQALDGVGYGVSERGNLTLGAIADQT